VELLEYIFCCIFIAAMTLAFICLAIYGLMWFIRLVVTTIRKWRKEDGK
jgi:hypothetical protein